MLKYRVEGRAGRKRKGGGGERREKDERLWLHDLKGEREGDEGVGEWEGEGGKRRGGQERYLRPQKEVVAGSPGKGMRKRRGRVGNAVKGVKEKRGERGRDEYLRLQKHS